uniref:Uncharacterized protein n=1 Tax=Desulfovibrio sp. U5L TaxID=596152 RepID=I2PZD6_9BACT
MGSRFEQRRCIIQYLTKRSLGWAVVILLLGVELTWAETKPTDQHEVFTSRLLPELAGLFVVATIMESALATLFNWRLYREFFNGRAVKTLVMIGFGYSIVNAFQYDIVARIIGIAGGNAASNICSGILSALVLAGGSAAVFELFKRLGLRPPVDPTQPQPQPAADKAWVSVRIVPLGPLDPVSVHFEKVDKPTQAQCDAPPLASVLAKKTFRERLANVFMTDPLRFPPAGGRSVEAEAVYRITVKARRRVIVNNEPRNEDLAEEVFIGRFAGRAIIDFVCRL